MNPYFRDPDVTVYHADNIEVLACLEENSVDAVVTDPPYALEFLGAEWDRFTPGEDVAMPAAQARRRSGVAFQLWAQQWAEQCLRVLKPGGHLLAFGGSRTWHRLAVGVEDAGFEIRDSIAWLHAQGLPKSLDIGKAMDRDAGVTREVIGNKSGRGAQPRNDFRGGNYTRSRGRVDTSAITAPATPEAAQWDGWGTALKPAFEPLVVARKPLAGTVIATVREYGTGGLNIAGSRVGDGSDSAGPRQGEASSSRRYQDRGATDFAATPGTRGGSQAGRWPPNVMLDEHAAAELDAQTGTLRSGSRKAGAHRLMGYMGADVVGMPAIAGDQGGPSRFFPTFRYCGKAPAAERPSYLGPEGDAVEHRDRQTGGADVVAGGPGVSARRSGARSVRRQRHHRTGLPAAEPAVRADRKACPLPAPDHPAAVAAGADRAELRAGGRMMRNPTARQRGWATTSTPAPVAGRGQRRLGNGGVACILDGS